MISHIIIAIVASSWEVQWNDHDTTTEWWRKRRANNNFYTQSDASIKMFEQLITSVAHQHVSLAAIYYEGRMVEMVYQEEMDVTECPVFKDR